MLMNMFKSAGGILNSGPSGISIPKVDDSTDIGTGADLGFGNILPTEESISTGSFSLPDVSNFSLPGAGDFSFSSITDKAAEVVQTCTEQGSAILTNITGFLNGDKSGLVNKITKEIPSPLNKIAASMDTNVDIDGSKYFVRLESYLFPVNGVTFDVTPDLQETRNATYEEVGITHHPGQILRYKTTGPRTWTVTAKLISRTPAEASKNLVSLNLIRSWVMPYFGSGTAETSKDALGAPPDILQLSAYGKQMIEPHPVVLESYNTTFPTDIDYIHTEPNEDGEKIPFPVILNITLNLKEAWSPKEFSKFDLSDYRKGNLQDAFGIGMKALNTQAKNNLPSYEDLGKMNEKAFANLASDEPQSQNYPAYNGFGDQAEFGVSSQPDPGATVDTGGAPSSQTGDYDNIEQ